MAGAILFAEKDMERREFEAWIEKGEAHARRDGQGYRRFVARWVWWGSAFYFGYLLLILLVLAAAVWLLLSGNTPRLALEIGIGMAVLLWGLIGALVVKVAPPDGRSIQPSEAPELFAAIEQVRFRIGAPKIDVVQVDQEFNAYAAAHRASLVSGREQLILGLGAPLMMALDRDEVLSVIGHELAHHNNGETRQSMKAYRLRARLERLWNHLARRPSLAARPLTAFYSWYLPRFSAISFALARQCEYDADRIGSEATSREAAIRAFLRMPVAARRWAGALDAWARTREGSPLVALLHTPPASADDAAEALRVALRRETTHDDTHPCATDRLRALGYEPPADPDTIARLATSLAGPPRPTAAESLLGSIYAQLMSEDSVESSEAPRLDPAPNDEELVMLELADFSAMSAAEFERRVFDLIDRVEASRLRQIISRARDANLEPPSIPAVDAYLRACMNDPEGELILRNLGNGSDRYAVLALDLLASVYERRGDSKAAYDVGWRRRELEEKVNAEDGAMADLLKAELRPLEGANALLAWLSPILASHPNVVAIHAFRSGLKDRPNASINVVAAIIKNEFLESATNKKIEAVLTSLRSLPSPPEPGASACVLPVKGPEAKRLAKTIQPIWRREK